MATTAVRRVDLGSPVLLLGLVLIVSTLAYNVRFLDTGGEQLPAEPTVIPPGPGVPFGPSGETFRLLFVGMILSLFVVSAIVAYIAWRRGDDVAKILSPWELLGYVFGIGLLLLMLLNWDVVVAGVTGLIRFVSLSPPPEPGAPGAGYEPWATSNAFPIAAVLFAIVLGVILIVNFSRSLFPGLAAVLDFGRADREKRKIAAEVVRKAVRQLETGGDYRTAVLACYQRMCSFLERQGVRSQETKTAREIEEEALRRLGLSQGSVDVLTGLFEEARYSAHEVGPAQRDRAVSCLEAIRRELEV